MRKAWPMEKVYGRSHPRITAKVGEAFILELEANFTTGYQWKLIPDSAKVHVADEQMLPGGPGVGARGRQRFRVEVRSPGAYALRAEYRRSWETEPREQLVFEIDVRPSG